MYFRETSCVQLLPPLLEFSREELTLLAKQKCVNIALVLVGSWSIVDMCCPNVHMQEVVQQLVTGNNPNSYSNQTAFFQQGMLPLVVNLTRTHVGER